MAWSYYVGIAACLMLSIVTIATFATLTPKDSAENTKLLTIIIVFCFVASLTAYALALYTFAANPNHLTQFLLMVMMIVVLPASLISAGVSTLAVSNLRDTLAAGN
jgi:hypothetical protein